MEEKKRYWIDAALSYMGTSIDTAVGFYIICYCRRSKWGLRVSPQREKRGKVARVFFLSSKENKQ